MNKKGAEIKESLEWLIWIKDHFHIDGIIEELIEKLEQKVEEYDEESLHMRQLLKMKLVDLDLSVRALNCLKAAEVDTLGDLVMYNVFDIA